MKLIVQLTMLITIIVNTYLMHMTPIVQKTILIINQELEERPSKMLPP